MKAATANATARLGRFVARCAGEPLEAKIAEKAAICMLDALGLALVARDERTAAAMRAATTPASGLASTARIWADGARAALSEAVAANAIAVHAHFQDDTDHNSWSHPGSLIVPVAVCAGESGAATLSSVLRAIVAGYSTMEWLGADEIVSLALIRRGLRTSPTFGTIGAAGAAAVALGLDAGMATNAVAIAAGITGGVVEPVRAGSDEWRFQNAHAARGGLCAAQLAAHGVLGAPDALEGAKGFLRSLAGLADTPAKWRADPDVGIMLRIMAKPWATLGDNMSAVAAAKLLHDDGVALDRVRHIRVRIWRPYTEYPGTSFKGPFERAVQTQASTAFATAAMLVYGELGYDIGFEHRDDPRILKLVELTEVEPDDEGTALDAEVRIELADGTKLRRIAAESPRSLIFQDRARATEVLEQRLVQSGLAPGAGISMAAKVFGAMDQGREIGIRSVLDSLGIN
ncbi:MAG: MmgE/PrpD family protein [Burkholderiales bacterium]|nr:MmgE/PrpD family protein [Burkholderiales bacterium]